MDLHNLDESNGARPPDVSIVIPVYNESDRIAASLEELARFLETAPFDAEVIIADDGSNDDSLNIVSERAEDFLTLRVLELPHGGKARAVLAGLAAAVGDVVGFMDADLATPLPTLAEAVERLSHGADVVIGSREGAGSRRIGEPSYRHVMGRVFNTIVRVSLLPDVDDTQCGFKFMTRDARDRILPLVQLYSSDETVTQPRVTAFDVELLYIAHRLGLTIGVIPVTWAYGTNSKVNPVRDTLQNLRDVLQVWLNGKRGRYGN